MKRKRLTPIAGLALVAAVWVVAGGSANASMVAYTGTAPLQKSDKNPTTAGVVGTIDGTTGQGQGGWGTFQQSAAQYLLNLDQSGSGAFGGEMVYANTVYEYYGTVDTTAGMSVSGGATDTTVPAGYDFAIAKYDGKNAGYVVFYLGGNSVALPSFPADFWTDKSDQYGISGWTAFNPIPEPTTMIMGALLLLPFGAISMRFLR